MSKDSLSFQTPSPLIDDEGARFAHHWCPRGAETMWPNRWLGVPAIQNPFDAWIIQEIIWETRPDVIIETGTLAGGGATLWASLLAMAGGGRVITIDVSNGPEMHPDAAEVPLVQERVEFVEGSSVDPRIVGEVAAKVAGERVMVILDSDHHKDHVLAELQAWGPLVTPGCYVVVQDGIASLLAENFGPGATHATLEWLETNPDFAVDHERERLLFTMCPSGFVKRLR